MVDEIGIFNNLDRIIIVNSKWNVIYQKKVINKVNYSYVSEK